jgi:hypothetical protein
LVGSVKRISDHVLGSTPKRAATVAALCAPGGTGIGATEAAAADLAGQAATRTMASAERSRRMILLLIPCR